MSGCAVSTETTDIGIAGQTVIVTATIHDDAGVLFDPAKVEVTVTPPDGGAATVKTWPTDVEVSHVSTGVFRYTVVVAANKPGPWLVQVAGLNASNVPLRTEQLVLQATKRGI